LLTTPDITGDTISFGSGSPWPSNGGIYTGKLVNDERIEGKWGRYGAAHALVKSAPSSCAGLPIEGLVSETPSLPTDPLSGRKP